MKKIYLLLLFLIPVLHGFCQENAFQDKPYATWREGDPIHLLKSAGTQTLSLKSASSDQIKVLLLTADSYATDVPATLLATGKFSVVDLVNYAVPTVAQLKSYDAVLVWADSGLDETIGDTLAAYIDGGGGVVSAVFNLFSPWGIETTRYITDYRLMDLGYYSSPATLGTVNVPGHPIMEGVNSINNPNDFRSNSTTVTPGSVIVAEWSDGLPLVVIKENLGPNNAKRADINIFPPSSNARSDFWDASTDGGILLANALVWASGKSSCPKDITVSTDSTSCGAVVEYTVNTPPDGSVVQTSGLPTGSEFPIGTTTNCFLLTDSLGVESTCCFTVTVVDSIAPVANCKGTDGSEELRKAAYVISTSGKPWGVNTNEQAMDMVFGSGNWNQLYYETLDVNNLLSDNYEFIFMEGGDSNADEMEAFVDANISKMEAWVLEGGNLFLNAAPNEGDGMNWGFWGITLQYNSGPFSEDVVAVDLNHAIFNGPYTPVTTEYSGTSFAHAIIPEELNVNFLINNSDNPDYHVLSEFNWGEGKVFVGGMTTTNFHSPQPDALNLRANMLHYLGTSTPLKFRLDSNGQVSITSEDIDGGSTDNCNIASLEIDRSDFTIADVGDQEVTLTVTDNAGNSSSCTTTVKILPPVQSVPDVVCNPIDIVLDEDGNYKLDSLDVLTIADGTNDLSTPFEDLILSVYPDTFNCANINNPVFVRLTAMNKDYQKTRCWAMVTVHDSTPPAISGANIELSLDEAGQAVLTTQMVTDSTVFDACGIDTTSLDKSIFTCDDLGENTVILTAVDIHGNIAADTILVTITDSQVPVVEPVTDLEITAVPGVCWTTIEYPVPVINDNCTYTLTQTGGLGPDAQFPIGTTTESWIVTDAAGNSVEIEFNVIIVAGNGLPTFDTPSEVTEDEDTPEILIPVTGISYGNDCKAQTVELTAVSDNNELISDIEVAYTDGESEAELKLTIAPDMNGTAKVTLTVKDEMDGMIYKAFNVTISPVNDAPVVVKPVEDQIVNASYVLKVPVSSALGELFDDADGDVLTLTAMMENGTPLPAWAELVGNELICSPMIEDKGNYTVVVKAADPEGASATDTFVVVVDGYPVSTPSIDAGFDIAMYPNPTAGRVQIELKNSGSKIEIAVFSITGSEVFRNTYYNTHLINLNMNEKGSGVYLVNINVDGKNIIKKLVVDKK